MTGTSLVATMASRYSMDPVMFARTLRSTVMPSTHTDEQFAAFLMVAERYGLNPLLREVYAFPGKGGGINPVVSIDGWIHLINAHPQFDGIEVTYVENPEGKGKPPISATCTIWRKDRSHPTVVTEFYSECFRGTEPWQVMPKRMLRHKAVKECARLAFGLAGIYDEDEARDIASRPGEPALIDRPKDTVTALDEFIAGAEEIDLDPFPGAPISQDNSGGVHSPSAAAEQGGGEGLQQASTTADPFEQSPAVAPHSSGVGSGEPPVGPSGNPSSLPPDAARKALIESAMQLATRPGFETDERLSMLDELRAEAGRLSGLPAERIMEIVTIWAKVARKELTKTAAQKYLESLP